MGELQIDHRPANEEYAKALSINLDDPVLCVSRVIQAEGRPVAYLIDVLTG